MDVGAVYEEAFGRIHDEVHHVVDGLGVSQLAWRADPEANSIAWLVWHLTRVQDDHVSEVAGAEQRWLLATWVERFALPYEPGATGYGQGSDEVGAVAVEAELLTAYFDDVHQHTIAFVRTLTAPVLDDVVDRRFDPPVTLGQRLVSVVEDDLQHVGQAAYIRGLLERAKVTH
jgi:hypothetical protein